jgi:hypothetical protein
MSSTSTRLPRPEGPGAGHRLAAQVPAEMLITLTGFLAPYREGGGGLL